MTVGFGCRGGRRIGSRQARFDAFSHQSLGFLEEGSDHLGLGDDPYHLDLSKPSLNRFAKADGTAVGDMYPNHFNNRHISWSFIPAPNYTGDIQIGFLQSAQTWWGAVSISRLPNGIHGVDYFADLWVNPEHFHYPWCLNKYDL